jgi:hypothetical protein
MGSENANGPGNRGNNQAGAGERWRVCKTLLPGQPGTLKLSRKYGSALVCVRYRQDEAGSRRTTVELVVEQVSVAPRIVALRLRFGEAQFRVRLLERGAHWDNVAMVWRAPYRVVTELGLERRIIDK